MINTVADIRAVHRGYWFSCDNMRFFRSKASGKVYGGKYFVSSEQFVDIYGIAEDRKYTVRVYDAANDKIKTVGKFQAYKTAADARAAIRELLKEESQK